MSNVWSKGPICGIDNCRSRLYRNADGRKICQYGHVREDDIEINDDEDDNFIITRRLKLPGNTATQLSQADSDQIKFGVQGKLLFFKCYQFILHKQCEIIIKEFGIRNGDELMDLVKLNWIKYLRHRRGDSNEFRYDIAFKMHTSVAIIYISCYALQIPVYIMDFYELISANRLPFMDASKIVPSLLKKNLPTYYLKLLKLVLLPDHGDLYNELSQLLKIYDITTELNYSNLIMKVLIKLVLPVQIFKIAEKLIQELKLDLKFEEYTRRKSKFDRMPDVKVIVVTMAAVTFFFHNHQDLLWKWVNIIDQVPDDKIDQDVDFTKLVDWEANKIDDYLNVISKFVLEQDTKEVDIAKRRVYDNFVPKVNDRSEGCNFYKLYEEEFVNCVPFSDDLLLNKFSKVVGITVNDLRKTYGRLFGV